LPSLHCASAPALDFVAATTATTGFVNNKPDTSESNIYFFHNQEDNNVAPERKLKHHHLCISFEILSGSAAIHLSYLQEIICCHESLASVSYFSVQSPAISVHFIFQRNEQTKKPSYAQPLASSRPIYADLCINLRAASRI